MRRFACLLAVLAAMACGGGPRSPFVRVMADSGRVYYADMRRTLHSESGGFLSFRCVVTSDTVRLKDGSYRALECPKSEVAARQRQYLRDHKNPVASDYEPEPE